MQKGVTGTCQCVWWEWGCSCVSADHTRNSQAGLTSEDILSDVGLGPSCHSGGAEGLLGVTGGWGWEGTGALACTYRA